MVNRQSANFIAGEGFRILVNKGNVSRALRRFLEPYLVESRTHANCMDLFQVFSYDEAFSVQQLDEIEDYAKYTVEMQRDLMSSQGIEATFVSTNREDYVGMVTNHYVLPGTLETATLAQLRNMLKAVIEVAETLSVIVSTKEFNARVLVNNPEYTYRGLPCTCAPEQELWEISGQDLRTKVSGVLEWCYSEVDAKAQMAEMLREPQRFANLKASSHAERQMPMAQAA